MKTIQRREFLKLTMLTPLFFSVGGLNLSAKEKANQDTKIFNKLISISKKKKWKKLPIGELMGAIGFELMGTPYAANTLEGEGKEICRVSFTGLDCVTFFENTLCMARVIKKGRTNFSDLIQEITYTRYRNAQLNGYPSRLHYTADWIYDNNQKRTVQDITESIGGIKHNFELSFMSQNPRYYKALTDNPANIAVIADMEKSINKRTYFILPKDKIAEAEKQIMTGDIIAIATNKKGLDYSHTGMAYVYDEETRFLHASSKHKKVLLDRTIHEYVDGISADIGITVLRPYFEDVFNG